MKTLGSVWLLMLFPLLLVAHPASAASPERDIVAILSATSLPDGQSLPGLLTGLRLMNGMRDALELVRGEVPKAAAPGLESIVAELRQLQAGVGPHPQLPASYRRGGELWLPVRAGTLQVRLDALGLLPRPRPGQAGGRVGNLPARAQRIVWLPVGRTIQLLAQARHWLPIETGGRERAQRLLAAALGSPQSSIVLEDRSLLLAYYDLQSALAAAPDGSPAVRDRLRRAAEALADDAGTADLADRLQAQADRLTPDLRGLQDLALALRKRIALAAGPNTGTGWSQPVIRSERCVRGHRFSTESVVLRCSTSSGAVTPIGRSA